MPDFWVIDSKCKVLPESSMPQDGSTYYFGRSVVPANDTDEAIALLTDYLKEDHIVLEQVLNVTLYQQELWDEDDEFDVHESYADALDSHAIELGCFASEKSYKRV